MKHKVAIALSSFSLLAVSTVGALPLNQHAASFQASRGVDEQFINKTSSGVSNTTTVSKNVVGAPPRNPHSTGNQVVSVTGWNSSVATNSRCSIATYNSLGAFVASKSFCVGSAAGCIVPPAPPAHWIQNTSFSVAEAPFSASYIVTCTLLPAGANTNRIHSVRVNP